MKKNLVIYISWLILHFLILWFNVENDVMLSLLIALPFSLFSVALAVYSVIYPLKRYRAEKRWRWVTLVPLLCILIGFVLYQLPVTDYRVICEHHLFQNSRLKEIETVRKQEKNKAGKCIILADTPERVIAVFNVQGGDAMTGTHDVVYISDDAEPTPELMVSPKIKIHRKLAPRWYYLYRAY